MEEALKFYEGVLGFLLNCSSKGHRSFTLKEHVMRKSKKMKHATTVVEEGGITDLQSIRSSFMLKRSIAKISHFFHSCSSCFLKLPKTYRVTKLGVA